LLASLPREAGPDQLLPRCGNHARPSVGRPWPDCRPGRLDLVAFGPTLGRSNPGGAGVVARPSPGGPPGGPSRLVEPEDSKPWPMVRDGPLPSWAFTEVSPGKTTSSPLTWAARRILGGVPAPATGSAAGAKGQSGCRWPGWPSMALVGDTGPPPPPAAGGRGAWASPATSQPRKSAVEDRSSVKPFLPLVARRRRPRRFSSGAPLAGPRPGRRWGPSSPSLDPLRTPIRHRPPPPRPSPALPARSLGVGAARPDFVIRAWSPL